MARQYEVKGVDAKTIGITVDGKQTVEFQIASDVQAEAVYKSLDYHPGDTYEFVDGGAGSLPEKPYEAFRDFLKSMIEGVNDVQPAGDQSGDGDGDDGNGRPGNLPLEQPVNDSLDEDIPF